MAKGEPSGSSVVLADALYLCLPVQPADVQLVLPRKGPASGKGTHRVSCRHRKFTVSEREQEGRVYTVVDYGGPYLTLGIQRLLEPVSSTTAKGPWVAREAG